MSGVRVIRQARCPAGCDGGEIGRQQRLAVSDMAPPPPMICPTCRGRGTVDEAVTCAGCRWWQREGTTCERFTRVGWVEADKERETELTPWCTCDDLDIPKQNQIVYTDEAFACAAWEARD